METIESINARIAVWEEAHLVVASGQSFSYSNGGTAKTFTMAHLSEIQATLEWLYSKKRRLQGKRRPVPVQMRPAR